MNTTSKDAGPPQARARRLLLIVALLVALALNLAPAGIALAAGNDSLTSATLISPPLSNDTTNTTTATRDPGEIGSGGPNCNFPLSGNTHSVWYKYTPSSNGFLTLDTFTSNYDTVLEVFTGPASPTFATLTSIACNDDSGPTSQSALTAQVNNGTHYYIVVRSFAASNNGGNPMTLKFSASFSSQHNIYVNQTTGNNTNPGTAARPVKTLQKGVDLAFPSGSIINIVTAGAYAESVTIDKNLTLKPTAGAVTVNSFTLASGAVVALAGSAISAPSITVQAGARIPDGIALAASGATVSVGNGTFAQNVTIAKSLTLRAINEGAAAIQPAGGTAVTISGGTVTLRGFNVNAGGAGTGVNITGGSSHTIYHNNITGNATGVVNATASAANGAQNFWGQASGPSHPSNPGGTGDSVSNNVTYRPWCTTAVPTCSPQAGIATRLVFNPSPSDSQATVAFPTQPVVEAQDNFGNIDTSYSGNVTVAIGTNPGGGTLAGTTTVAVSNGKATFSGLSINKVGTGYTLQATSGALTGTSAAFDITVGPAAKLVFNPSPSNSTATVPFATQPVVEVQDAGGNLVTGYSGNVTVAIGTNPGSGTLAGTTTIPVSNGKATFSGLSIDKVGTGYTLQATSGALTGTSAAFDITVGPAAKLVFNPSPSNSTATVPFATQPVVEVQDAGGNLVTGYSGNVTVAIGTNPGGGTLAGTTTIPVSGGQASFSGLSIDKVGVGYTLQATSSPALTPATSALFDITKTNATVTLSNLSYTYDGNPHAATATTNPAGLTVDITYNGSPTAPTNAGSYNVVATVNDPNYQGSATGTLVIAKATATVTLSNLSYTYDGNPHAATATTNPAGLTVDITYNGSPTAPTNAGSYNVVATVNDLNYQGSATGTLVIAKANATITLGSLTATYDGSQHAATATTNPPALTVDFRYNGSPSAPVNAGSYTVVATIVNINYQGTTTGTLTINKASQTITFGALANKVYGDPPFTLSASASSGLAVSYSAAGQCTVVGATVTLTGVGSCTITASQSGNANYIAAASVARTFTIAKVNQTINFAALQDRAYTNPPFTLSASASSGLAVTFSAAGQCTISGSTVTLTGALGSCTITASQSGNANYTAAVPVAQTFSIVSSFRRFLPIIMNSPQADLVGSFSLSPNSLAPNHPVTITVTITNQGTVAASQFWVDFYINPSVPPTDTNQPWNKRCGLNPCYGIAWYISGTVEPGQSITLTSTPNSYFGPNTRWAGMFAKGTSDLYLYVDSWNPGVAVGAVAESDETNNRAEYHGQPASSEVDTPTGDLGSPDGIRLPDDLPPRPVRP